MTPLLLVALPLAMGPLTYLLRRWGVAALLAAATALSCAVLTLRLPVDQPGGLLGRDVAFDQVSQVTLTLIFGMAFLLFLAAWRVPQGRSFPPLVLSALGLFVAAVLAQQLAFVVLLVELAVVLAALAIQAGRHGSARGALRFLVMTTLALPFLLTAAWRIELYVANADNVIYLGQATLLLGMGFLLWLAVVPFHGWVPAVAAEAPQEVAAFVFNTFPLVVLTILIHLLHDQEWLVENPQVLQALFLGGLATALLGGVLAAFRRSFNLLLGYAALSDLGVILVALGTGSYLGGMAAGLALVNRAVALALTAAAGASLRHQATGDGFDQVAGMARAMPFTTLGLFIGGFSLAGGPLTGGFASRWLLLHALRTQEVWPAAVLLLAGAGVAFGYVRGLGALLTFEPAWPSYREGGDRPVAKTGTGPSFRREPLLATTLIVLMTFLALALGLYPQLVIPPLQHLADVLASLHP
jgi:multicomponent Na+:H+ antiporter subunit D